jgi:phosphate transport system permease protein
MSGREDIERVASSAAPTVKPLVPRPVARRPEVPESPSGGGTGDAPSEPPLPPRAPPRAGPDRWAFRTKSRARFGTFFAALCFLATLVGVLVLVVLLFDIIRDGIGRLNLTFIDGFPSRFPDRAGIKPALLGSAWVMMLTALIAFPLGVGTAIWLEEYAPDNRFTRIIETNIANLAGVPSIVYGILGLALFVRAFAFGRSIMAAAFTLALLILPVIIIASQEAVKAVPNSIRLGAYALGATRWEAIRHHVLPLALPGILTGTILALSRAIGEAAPVILVGALGFISYVPSGPMDNFTVIPFQIYNWVSRPQAAFAELAAAASIVLLVLLLTMNAAAIWLRNRYTRKL